MPDHVHPGVFLEETSFRSKSIEGVSTSNTAFVGPTRYGPVGEASIPLTHYGEFETLYGGLDLIQAPQAPINLFAHAVRAYFNEGGKRLCVSRVFPISGPVVPPNPLIPKPTPGNPRLATAIIRSGSSPSARPIGFFQARFPGKALEGTIAIRTVATRSTAAEAVHASPGTLFRVIVSPPPGRRVSTSTQYFTKEDSRFRGAQKNQRFPETDTGHRIEILTLHVELKDAAGRTLATHADLGFHPSHPRYLGTVLSRDSHPLREPFPTPYAFIPKPRLSPFRLRQALDPSPQTFALTGAEDPPLHKAAYDAALKCVGDLAEVSLVAAPGYTEVDPTIATSLIAHCEQEAAYRFAVLDVPRNHSPAEARQTKAAFDSKYAALNYPWVVVPHPAFNPAQPGSVAEILLPPSAFLCGIYARNDAERGVHKAPANEVVRTALRFERVITTAEQDVLNPLGINCLRFFPGRGHRVWGARTTSSDPEWKYIHVRRYFNYLEHSICRGTQWAVFEPNGPSLWSRIQNTISSFLLNEWQQGALLGTKAEQAFFVRCDPSTMSANDLHQGRLVCLVGVAIVKPAEFIMFRIGQRTADAQA